MTTTKTTYKHEVIADWAKHLKIDRTQLEEFVLEWDEAKQAPICEECGDPMVGDEPTVVDETDGTLIHAECATEREPKDFTEDHDYYRDDFFPDVS